MECSPRIITKYDRNGRLKNKGAYFSRKGEARCLYYHNNGLCSKEWCKYCRQQGYTSSIPSAKEIEIDQAYKRGFAETTHSYKVPYNCAICGKEITVDTPEEKETIKQFLESNKWYHDHGSKGDSNRKVSLDVIWGRIKKLIREVKSMIPIYSGVVKCGVKPSQLNWEDMDSKIKEIDRLLPLLPANERG